MRQILKIEKLVSGGQAIAHLEGKTFFVWNALPNETVEAEIIKNKKNYCEAVAIKIISESPFREKPKEEHFLSSSPWQIIKWEKENEFKKQIAIETYQKIGGVDLDEKKLEIEYDNSKPFGYRNKIEFSFAQNSENEICLAFFERGQNKKTPITGCLLAEPAINETANKILEWINHEQIPIRSLKSLIIRSTNNKKTIAGLFIKDKLKFQSFPKLNDNIDGIYIYYSTHKSPASVPTELLWKSGNDYLTADIHGTKLKFGLFSFFQINIPVFEQALKDIYNVIYKKNPILDLYSGVGSISLPLKTTANRMLVDNCEDSIKYAKENIGANGLQNCEAKCSPAEKILEQIDGSKTIIVDPPRAGLHEKVIKRLLEQTPESVIYLSCDLATQARDIKLLSEKYQLDFVKLYNFFPRTPHVEGLCVLTVPKKYN
jgi:23S rRNA (uracil1939-C5)-methyltransferase